MYNSEMIESDFEYLVRKIKLYEEGSPYVTYEKIEKKIDDKKGFVMKASQRRILNEELNRVELEKQSN